MLVTSQKNGCYHRLGYLTERLKTQCLSQKSEIVSVAQWIERCPPKEGACLTPLNYRKKNSIVRICQSKCYIACHQRRMYRGKLDGVIHPESISN